MPKKKTKSSKMPATTKEPSMKALLALHNKDMKRYVGALSEEFQGRVSGVAEQFGTIDRKLDVLTKTVDGHTQILQGHTQKLDEHTQMIGQLLIDMEEVKNDLKQNVRRDEFARLEKRLVFLETTVHSFRRQHRETKP